MFAGFSAEALAGRINDAEAKVVITADGSWRRGKAMPLKAAVDAAIVDCPTIEHVLMVRRLGDAAPETTVQDGRDVWWHDFVDRQPADCAPVAVDSEQLLYLLYTSGTTAKPKGIIHTTAGYLVGTSYTHRMIFDLKPDDIYWCAADVGWVTGHSYIVYGPLANASTGILYEGSPDTPAWDRWWQIIEDYKVTILYCAPTAIRAFMKQGSAHPAGHDLSSLRVLGSVGEPINPEAWLWYREHIGGNRAPIVDTWWQTETGQILITPLPGVTVTKPGSATFPFPGIAADIVDGDGASVPFGGGGYLVLKRPWPAMLRGIHGDPERYKETYWKRFPGMYFAGDGAKRDEEGYFWLLGRVDDVMNVSGHRLSTTEIESALVSHPAVAEAAVVGGPDPVTGEAINAFVILRLGFEPTEALGSRAPSARRHEDQPDRQAKGADVHARPAQDPEWQDHAAPAPRYRPGPLARRHDHPGRCSGGRDDPGEQLEGRGLTPVPFDFLRRNKESPPETPAPSPPTVSGQGVQFEGMTEDWRLVGRMLVDGRLSDALNRREPITLAEMRWAPMDGSEGLAPAPGLKSVDPYDLVLVIAGEDSLPSMTDSERSAHKVHKVTYEVGLEVPPYRVIGTVMLYPGYEPARLMERSNEMFVPIVERDGVDGHPDRQPAGDGRDPRQPAIPSRRRADRRPDGRALREATRRLARGRPVER